MCIKDMYLVGYDKASDNFLKSLTDNTRHDFFENLDHNRPVLPNPKNYDTRTNKQATNLSHIKEERLSQINSKDHFDF